MPVSINPNDRLARWNACAIDRICNDSDRRPRPLVEQLASHLSWVEADPERRDPRLERV